MSQDPAVHAGLVQLRIHVPPHNTTQVRSCLLVDARRARVVGDGGTVRESDGSPDFSKRATAGQHLRRRHDPDAYSVADTRRRSGLRIRRSTDAVPHAGEVTERSQLELERGANAPGHALAQPACQLVGRVPAAFPKSLAGTTQYVAHRGSSQLSKARRRLLNAPTRQLLEFSTNTPPCTFGRRQQPRHAPAVPSLPLRPPPPHARAALLTAQSTPTPTTTPTLQSTQTTTGVRTRTRSDRTSTARLPTCQSQQCQHSEHTSIECEQTCVRSEAPSRHVQSKHPLLTSSAIMFARAGFTHSLSRVYSSGVLR